jgi:Rhs element Vgr protein
MPESAESPSSGSDGVIRLTIESNGRAIEDTVHVISVHVRRAIGQIDSARIELSDGDMPTQGWPIANGEAFAPGAAIRISAGYGDTKEETIFVGIVVQLGMRIDGDNGSRIVIECRHRAVALTVSRRNRIFVDKTDSQAIESLVGEYGLAAIVDATPVQHRELVQYGATDWDFLSARAEANGLLVLPADDGLHVKRPDTRSAAALKVAWGIDLMEFHADLDARAQLTSVKAVGWSLAQQATLEGQAAQPATIASQGNLGSATLAQVLSRAEYRLHAPLPASADELTEWAKAQQLKSALARIRGHMKFQGSAKAQLAGLIELAGVGERYSGSVFVTAIEHEISDGNWTTQAEFGQPAAWVGERADVSAPPASALLPGIGGLHVGVVSKLDPDPAGQMRIQIRLPALEDADGAGGLVWARLAQGHASAGFGAFFAPEVGDEVVVGFFNEDPRHAVVLGSMYSAMHKPAVEMAASNRLKSFTTRSGHRFEFDDQDKVVTLTTKAGNRVVLSDKDKSILLVDQNQNRLTLDPDGIRLEAPKDVGITAKGAITLDAVGAITFVSKGDIKSQGLNVSCEAQVEFVAKGSASAELSAAGQTTVKGAMVMIN